MRFIQDIAHLQVPQPFLECFPLALFLFIATCFISFILEINSRHIRPNSRGPGGLEVTAHQRDKQSLR